MDPQGQFVAALLDASGRAYASGAVQRLRDLPAGSEVDRLGTSRLITDVQARIACLAESLASGRAELFEQEVAWLGSTWAARGASHELLRSILQALREELNEDLPKVAAVRASSVIDGALGKLTGEAEASTTLLTDGLPHVDLARRFLMAIFEGQRSQALDLIVGAYEAGASIPDLHGHVLARVQAELGRLWQVGDSVASEEHVGTRIVEDALTLLRTRMSSEPSNGNCVLIASVRGNLHDIGARMVADQFELAGWRSVLLGADTPTDDLVEATSFFGADLLALSAGRGHNVRATAEIIFAIRERLPQLPILVGGLPFTLLPDLWQSVGADGSAADAPGAVREGQRLLELS